MNTVRAADLADRWCSNPVRRNIDAALLRTFVAVVETGSLRKAGDAVFRTQAAVSQQLKRLEEVARTRLFRKSGRRLALTPAGERLVDKAKELLLLHDELLSNAAAVELHTGASRLSDLPPGLFPELRETRDDSGSAIGGDCGSPHSPLPARFEENIRSPLQRAVLEFWRERGSGSSATTISVLVEAGILSRASDLAMVFAAEENAFKCIDATDVEIRDFRLDRFGFGISDEQMIENPAVLAQRRKMYLASHHSALPLFYSGNAVMPSNSPIVAADPAYITTALDRLLLPVRIDDDTDARGLLIVASWDERRSYAESLAAESSAAGGPPPTITERVALGV